MLSLSGGAVHWWWGSKASPSWPLTTSQCFIVKVSQNNVLLLAAFFCSSTSWTLLSPGEFRSLLHVESQSQQSGATHWLISDVGVFVFFYSTPLCCVNGGGGWGQFQKHAHFCCGCLGLLSSLVFSFLHVWMNGETCPSVHCKEHWTVTTVLTVHAFG